ncbi:MAG: Rho termination factor N-terminal domain-containing protein [Deltaproteobacteria bacterium]|nr:Rho termination factor N-terminal domain-containing protein [Deltaproteobacteria bacterium]
MARDAREEIDDDNGGGDGVAEVRPFWSGTVTFGLVSIPVELFAAYRSSRTSLRMLSEDGQPLRRRYVCSADGEPLEADEIVRGAPREDDAFVTVSDEELASVAPEKSREIDLQRFVPRDAIDPFACDRAYFLLPADEVTKPYRLLSRVMEATGQVGLASFVMRDHAYHVAISSVGGILRAETLRAPDELRTLADVGVTPPDEGAAGGRLAKMKEAVRALREDALDPAELRDADSAAIAALAQSKAEEAVDVVEPPAGGGEDTGGGSIIDIMDVLRQRLGVKAADGARGGAETGGSDMPQAWSEKDERQYEHVKKSEKDRGKSTKKAEEIAARTVNKQRREEGRTPNETTQGTGNPNKGLEARTKDELYNRAKELDIDGRSKMTKDELIRAIRKAG